MKSHKILLITFRATAIVIFLCGCVDSNQEFHVNCPGPLVLEEFHVWRDGGSLSFVFLCSDNSRLSFRLQGGLAELPTTGHFYIKDDKAVQDNRILLPLGGVEEKRLLNVMNSWLESKFSNEDLERIINSTDFPNMTEDEFRAWHIKHLVDSRPKVVKELLKREYSN